MILQGPTPMVLYKLGYFSEVAHSGLGARVRVSYNYNSSILYGAEATTNSSLI